MTVAKRFHWEAAHRLPEHPGRCRHLHGHSYKMSVEVEGAVGPSGMVADFGELKAAVAPLVEAWDHATLVSAADEALLGVVRRHGWKHFVFDGPTTAEGLARFAAEHVAREAAGVLAACRATRLTVRLAETASAYVVHSLALAPAHAGGGTAAAAAQPA